MTELDSVDRVEVHVIIDNATDSLSTVYADAESEFAYLAGHGMMELAGDALCCACHGFSLLITTHRADRRDTVLFDSGPEAYAFERNCTRLGLNLGVVDAVMLSHGHWDHGGGMLTALDMIRAGDVDRRVPYYAHPDMFRSRGRRLPDGRMMPQQDVPDPALLAAHGAEVVATREPYASLDGAFHLSGEIPRVTPFEHGLAAHFQRDEAGEWRADPWLIDERFLTVNVGGKGLVVFTACSHAGVINVLAHARALFPAMPIHAVMGGFHLAGPNEPLVSQTVEAMKEFDLCVIAAGHCTGWRAVTALTNTFGERVVNPSAVGKRYVF
jgi:7,8-dihydropterin-6-yl-methyl-4-(beta-D-ribofuranosyl)aminobenzene 5'-phosphate synthase